MKDTQTNVLLVEALNHLARAHVTLEAALDPKKVVEAKEAGVWDETHLYIIDLYRQQIELLRDQINLYITTRIRESLYVDFVDMDVDADGVKEEGGE